MRHEAHNTLFTRRQTFFTPSQFCDADVKILHEKVLQMNVFARDCIKLA